MRCKILGNTFLMGMLLFSMVNASQQAGDYPVEHGAFNHAEAQKESNTKAQKEQISRQKRRQRILRYLLGGVAVTACVVGGYVCLKNMYGSQNQPSLSNGSQNQPSLSIGIDVDNGVFGDKQRLEGIFNQYIQENMPLGDIFKALAQQRTPGSSVRINCIASPGVPNVITDFDITLED